MKQFFKPGTKQSAPTPIQIDSSKYLDLDKFWQIAQESNTSVLLKTKDLALNSLIEILQGQQIPRQAF